jgi:hypothetical protein
MMNKGKRPLVPRNYRETHAHEKASEKPLFFRPNRGGKDIPAFNGAHKGNKNRPITLAKHA